MTGSVLAWLTLCNLVPFVTPWWSEVLTKTITTEPSKTSKAAQRRFRFKILKAGGECEGLRVNDRAFSQREPI